MDISKIDKNFAIEEKVKRENTKIYNVCESPFKVYGLIYPQNENDFFHRMPFETAKKLGSEMEMLNHLTAGGRVKFVTDSKYIGIRAEMNTIYKMPHFSLSGSAGMDLYIKKDGKHKWIKSFIPQWYVEDGFEDDVCIQYSGMYEYTINLPSYSGITNLYIILDENAKVFEWQGYECDKPIVYYGSSITQGACASRPGNTYQSIIERKINYDYINLGFSGNAKGEIEMAEYIASIPMKAFVYDYDHNAPSVEHLRETHYRMFNIIRNKQPDLPIICVSRPDYHDFGQIDERRQVIIDTVEKAKALGDKNVYFVDGLSFADELGGGDSILVDGCHPNDLGFMSMANGIGRTLENIIKDL